MQLRNSVRSRLKSFIPGFVLRGVRNAQTMIRRRELPETKRIFENAKLLPAYLAQRELELLEKRYPFRPGYGYDPRSTERRGIVRAKELLRLPRTSERNSYLELGCWDGMVCRHLQHAGKTTTAIDVRSDGFDERAQREGVKFILMDAEHLQFPEESFDFVFSYDSFEHFSRPDAVFHNAIKVLRKGGLLALSFGPLYLSPYGQHAYRSIPVPYCHILFPPSMLNDFAAARGLTPIDFGHVNGWTLGRYREFWDE